MVIPSPDREREQLTPRAYAVLGTAAILTLVAALIGCAALMRTHLFALLVPMLLALGLLTSVSNTLFGQRTLNPRDPFTAYRVRWGLLFSTCFTAISYGLAHTHVTLR